MCAFYLFVKSSTDRCNQGSLLRFIGSKFSFQSDTPMIMHGIKASYRLLFFGIFVVMDPTYGFFYVGSIDCRHENRNSCLFQSWLSFLVLSLYFWRSLHHFCWLKEFRVLRRSRSKISHVLCQESAYTLVVIEEKSVPLRNQSRRPPKTAYFNHRCKKKK